MADKYQITIILESNPKIEFSVGETKENRDFAIRIYGDIKKNYSKPENLYLKRLKESEKWEEVVLSDIEKELIK